jgi:hypothetical protein
MPQTEEPNRRVLQEIEQILEEDERKNDIPVRISKPVKPRRVRVGTPWWMPTAEKAIVAGMLLLIAGAVYRPAVLPLAIAGITISGLGYFALIRRRRRARTGVSVRLTGAESTTYWRGRRIKPGDVKKRNGNVLDFPDTWQNRLRRKFSRRR